MQAKIHPKTEPCAIQCSCGHKSTLRSTLCKDFHIDVCANCHPFYTGQQKIVDTAGRIESFSERFSSLFDEDSE
jgi:large subunit ribosomal protein L31